MDKRMTLQAAVDDDFRAELMASPAAFGAAAGPLPDPIEQPDHGSLEFWMKSVATEIYACPDTHHCVHTYHCARTY